ncbi:FAD-binding oxidoreductase [Pseudonocardia sp. WMMC193]|uniref:FAD-binding oxidoreductase n=1 Tax=Pseudonocardia sp. WMMC193 TaxID=2911965 RepID=UPI0035ABDBFC
MDTYGPDTAEYATLTTGYQTNRPHRPDVVAVPRTVDEVREALALDGPHAVQSSGHGRVAALDGGVLLSTTRLTGVTVDPRARTARIAAGSTWGDVVAATTPHGLAPVNGSSPGVGVVGYLRGGGFGILSRAFGTGADHLRAVEGVTPDGRAVRTDRMPTDATVVTAVEIGLVELPRVWGGALTVPVTDDLPARFAEATAGLPPEVTASLTLVPFPDSPGLPPHLRGTHLGQVRVVGTREITLPDLGGEGTLRWLPYAEAHTIHADPPTPHAYAGEARLLRTTTPALDGVVAATSPTAGVPSVIELRPLGGKLADGWILRAVTALDPVTEPRARAAHETLFAPFAGVDEGPVRTFCYGRPTP